MLHFLINYFDHFDSFLFVFAFVHVSYLTFDFDTSIDAFKNSVFCLLS